jgi:hypothetical protein
MEAFSLPLPYTCLDLYVASPFSVFRSKSCKRLYHEYSIFIPYVPPYYDLRTKVVFAEAIPSEYFVPVTGEFFKM